MPVPYTYVEVGDCTLTVLKSYQNCLNKSVKAKGCLFIAGLGLGSIPGADVMILKIFSPKNSAKKLAFLSQNNAQF
jgi:hypothetical protein